MHHLIETLVATVSRIDDQPNVSAADHAAVDDLVRKLIETPAASVAELAAKLDALNYIARHVAVEIEGPIADGIRSVRDDARRLSN